MRTPRRQPKGIPSGGRFAPDARSAAPVTLGLVDSGPAAFGGDDRTRTAGAPGDPRVWHLEIGALAAASRDRDLHPVGVAALLDARQPLAVRHDTVNRGTPVVLALAAGDQDPVVRVAAWGSAAIPAHTRYALRRDVAVQGLAEGGRRLAAAS